MLLTVLWRINFLLPGHAVSVNLENDGINYELCDFAVANLTERIGFW